MSWCIIALQAYLDNFYNNIEILNSINVNPLRTLAFYSG